jgi:uncharacterized protein
MRMPFQGVRWTEWSEDHIARHEVVPDEVEDVLFTRPQFVQTGKNNIVLVYGTTMEGRRLLVVCAPSSDDDEIAFIVTARDMTDKENRTFKKKAR